jgi:hypothetical protein
VSEDPIQDGSNWYAFAGNDPVNYADPSGLSPSFHPLNIFGAGSTLSRQTQRDALGIERTSSIRHWRGLSASA